MAAAPPPGGVLLLDGGMGHLLKSKGVEQLLPGLKFDELFLAGTLANVQRPELVMTAHREYIDAGAHVITTNSFSCTQWALEKIRKQAYQIELVEAAGKLARQAVAECGRRDVLVAGSLPPLQDSYQSQGLAAFEMQQPQYEVLANALQPHCDLLLCETLSTVTEGAAAASAAAATGLPWWISWTLEDNEAALLRSGEPLARAVAAVAQLPGLQVLLVNCCSPAAVTAALPVLRAAAPGPGVLVGGYANGFATPTSEWLAGGSSSDAPACLPPEEYDSEGLILPEAYAAHAKRWVAAGAAVVGGCCGVGPAHIAAVAEGLGLVGERGAECRCAS